MYPKTSIVTPSYNQNQYLEDTILSVLGQGYPNLEYLIYDAASTDNSVEILKTIDFKNNSPKVICVEAAEYSPFGIGERRNELIDFLVKNNYYEYANTNLNAIMVRKDFWFK